MSAAPQRAGQPGRGADPLTRPPGRHHRDRLTVSLYAFFVAWGWFLYAFSPIVPLLASEQGISRAQAGLHGTSMAVGTVLTAFVSARIAARLGRRGTLWLAGAVLAAGVGLLVSGTVTALTLVGAGITAVGGTLAISAAQPTLAVHHGERSPSAVAEANGAGALVGLVAPLAVGACVAAGWGWRPAVAFTAVLVVVACVLVGRVPGTGALGRPEPVAVDVTAAAAAGAHPAGRPRFSRAYWLFWTALLAAVSIENATTFWVADLVGERTGAGPGIATAALSGLVGGMALVRFTLSTLLRRRTPESVLVAAFAVAAAGWLVVWTATTTPVALAGLVLAGLGYGAQYPLAIALILRASAGRPDQAQAGSTLGVGLAVGCAPFVLGALADRVGPHTAFLLVPVLMVLGAGAVVLGRRAERG